MTLAEAPVKRIAPSLCEHAARRFLRDEKTTERRDSNGALDLRRIEIDERATHSRARVVHDNVRLTGRCVDVPKKAPDLLRIDRVAGERARTGFGAKRVELVGMTRSERDTHAFTREEPRQSSAQALAGADDQRALVPCAWHTSRRLVELHA